MRVSQSAERLRIFLVRHILHPGDMLSVQRFLHRDVHHAGVGSRAVPVLLVWRNPDCVTRLDLADRSAFRLYASDAGDDMQRLSEWMGVPCRTRAGLEAHAAGADTRG